MKSKRTKACGISPKARAEVHKRDGKICVFCGKRLRERQLAHVISRSHGGMGIPENLVTLGSGLECDCHYTYDHGTSEQRCNMRRYFEWYLKQFYPEWSEENLIYRK